jgi:hypothetical protein
LPASGKLVVMIVDARQAGARNARVIALLRPAAVMRPSSVIAALLRGEEALRLTGP